MNLFCDYKDRIRLIFFWRSDWINSRASRFSFFFFLKGTNSISFPARVIIFTLVQLSFTAVLRASEIDPSKENSLTGTLTANCMSQSTTYYNWSLTKTFSPQQTPFVIKPGKTVPATFSISVRKGGGFTGEGVGPITGQVCLTNSTPQSTQNLKIYTLIQAQTIGGFQDIATQDISVTQEIAPGETRCYFYIYNNLITNTQKLYKVSAYISTGSRSFLSRKPNSFTLSTPLQIHSQNQTMDDTATLKDVFQCPTGFSCTPLSFTGTYTGPRTLSYQVLLSNQSAACGQILYGLNTATLIGNTSQYSQSASAQIKIFTGKCNSLNEASLNEMFDQRLND